MATVQPILEVSLCLLALVAFIALHGPVQKCTTFNCSVYQSIIIHYLALHGHT